MNVTLAVNYRKIDVKNIKREYKELVGSNNLWIDNSFKLSFIRNDFYRDVYNEYKSWVSNASKGNNTNFDQLSDIFSEDRNTKEIMLQGFSNTTQEEFEILNLKKIYDQIDDFSFTLKDLKKVNYMLGRNITEKNWQENRGTFKKDSTKIDTIKINNETTYNVSYCEPKDVKPELEKLLSFVKSKLKKNIPFKDTFILATIFLIEFNRIHPFENGNGRIAKIFSEKIFEKNNFFPLILFDSNGKEEFKKILNSSEFLNESSNDKHNYRKMIKDLYKLYEPKSRNIMITFDIMMKRR